MKFRYVILVMALATCAATPAIAQRPDSVQSDAMGAILRLALRQSNQARLALDLRDSLTLNDSQIRQLELEASRGDSILAEAMRRMQGSLRGLPPLDSRDPIDEGKVREVYQRRAQAEADFYIARYRAGQAIARILTPVQQQRFDAQIAAQRARALGGATSMPLSTSPPRRPK